MKHRAVALVAALAALTANARAEDAALAEALFGEGKALMEAHQFDQACPKLEESYAQQAATGTLLALAMCREAQGKLATAWATYGSVAARAKRNGDSEREEYARERVQALEPRLSRVTIEVPEALASAEVRRDGEFVPASAWGTPIPTDPGPHTIEVTAAGHKPWKHDFTLAAESDAQVVRVPMLEPEQTRAATPTQAPLQDSAPTESADSKQKRQLRIASYAALGVSVVGAGLGTWFAVSSKNAYDDANEFCPSFPCRLTADQNDERNDLADEGKSFKTASIISFVAAGLGLGAGITLFVLSSDSSESAPGAPTAKVTWTPGGGLGSFALEGSF